MKLGRKFLEGGPMPQGAAPQGGGEDPVMMLVLAAQQALLTQDCQLAMQVCQMVLELVGGGAPQEAAPQEAAPAEGEPVYRKGGRLVRRIR